MTEPRWTNWHGIGCRPRLIATPGSLTELASVLREAAGLGSRVLVVGGGHSYNDLTLTSATLVRLDRLDRVEHINAATGLVRVQAGARIRDLREVLAAHGLAFAALGDTDGQTIAGAIATATHGTGLGAHSLSGQVAACQLMLADGSVREITENEPELLDAVRCSLGVLGVVTAVTIRAVPAFTLCQVERKVGTAEALAMVADPPEVDHFKAWFMPYTGTAMVSGAHPVPLPARPGSRAGRWLRENLLINGMLNAAGTVARRWPRQVPLVNRWITGLASGSAVIDRSDRIFVLPISISHDTFEYAVPLHRGRDAVAGMLEAVRRTRPALALPCEVRFQPAERGWLDPRHDQASVCVGAAWHRGAEVGAFLHEVEAVCRELGGRPHWAKWHSLTAAELAPLYPRWDGFQELRRSLDPGGLFGSVALDRYLGAAERNIGASGTGTPSSAGIRETSDADIGKARG